jgi:hypothetical protein
MGKDKSEAHVLSEEDSGDLAIDEQPTDTTLRRHLPEESNSL